MEAEHVVAEEPAVTPRRSQSAIPLSYAQEGLWFLEQLGTLGAAYYLPTALRLRGALDVPALERSFAELVRRHESLRTRFEAIDGVPRQVIDEPGALQWSCKDLSDRPPERREDEARRLMHENALLRFDLARGPLFRVLVLRLAVDEHELLVTVHHIVSDGVSQAVLNRELSVLYAAFADGCPSPLAPLRWQYADYAIWQRRSFEERKLDTQLRYWRAQLQELAPLRLPTDRARPEAASGRGAVVAVAVPKALLFALRELGRAESATLYMVLLAAFNVLMGRLCGQKDVVVGTPTSGRVLMQTEEVIGFFVNTFVMRTDLSGDPSFVELLARVRDVALDAHANQDVPFERLVAELQPERTLSRAPLVQVQFGLQSATQQTLELRGVRVERQPREHVSAQFDLALRLFESSDNLYGFFEYATDLLDQETVQRWARALGVILRQIAVDPCKRLSQLQLSSRSDLHQVLVGWNATHADYPDDCLIHESFEVQAKRVPDAVAAIFEDRQLTYAELNRKANRLAHGLMEQGIGAEQIVAVVAPRSLEMLIALLGILKAGAAYLPIDPDTPTQRMDYMLKDAGATLLLTAKAVRGQLTELSTRLRVCTADELDVALRTENPGITLSAHNLIYCIYTSGSTGLPKGVANTHGGLRNRLQWMQQTYQLSAVDRVLQKTPFTFDVSVWELFWPLMSGATLVVAPPYAHQDPAQLGRIIERERVSVAHFVPSMLSAFITAGGLTHCRSLRYVLCSGEALAYEVQRRFQRQCSAELHNLYGPTEASIDVTHWMCRDDARATVPIGQPIANTQVYVLDEHLSPAPIGVVGELHLAGVGLARGYLGRPALTAERFLANPFAGTPGERLYRTGDWVRYRADGNLEFVGRADHQVKIRGYRIELGEIETVLCAYPGVHDAVVLAREDLPGERRLVAYVRSAAVLAIRSQELREHLRKSLPEYMMPAAFVMLEELPLTSSGKLNRQALPAPALNDPTMERTGLDDTPRNDTERVVAQIFADVLGQPSVAVNDDFFDAGGHSLLATQVVSRILQTLDIELPADAIFHHSTPRELASYLVDMGLAANGIEPSPGVQ